MIEPLCEVLLSWSNFKFLQHFLITFLKPVSVDLLWVDAIMLMKSDWLSL